MVIASLDFGTTNSVAGVVNSRRVEMIPLSKDSLETKSTLFYNFDDKNFYVGQEAINELKMGEMGRYFISLKSFLGSANEIETTLGRTTYKLSELIAIILKNFKNKIERAIDKEVNSVVLGRPVRFNDKDEKLDKLAQNRLEEAAKIAGFKEVKFLYEPIAAAKAYKSKINKDELILVADIGGGTTDYSIVKLSKKDEIIATNGVYIGGNNFDSKIIKNYVNSHLGEGSKYKIMGKDLEIETGLYSDLSQWHLFQRMYNKDTIDMIEKYIFMAYEKHKIKRLLELIKHNLYFDFSQKIVDAKVELSSKELTILDMNIFSKPFKEKIYRNNFNQIIANELGKIEQTLNQTLKVANLKKEQIDKVFLTGGSTYIPAVKDIFLKNFSKDKLIHTDVLSSVGYGLALEAKNL